MSGTVAGAFKAAIYAKCLTLFPDPVQVAYTAPLTYLADEIVGLGDITASLDPATMGTPRSREEVATLDLIISVYAGGDDQQAVTERAYAMLATLEADLRSDYSVGNLVRWATVSGHDLAEAPSVTDGVVVGRVAEIAATITYQQRV